jgi:spore cortex formation protein SpoVR/YcgB (stage V sporulation)
MAIGKCYVFPDMSYETKFKPHIETIQDLRKNSKSGNAQLPLFYRYVPPMCSGLGDMYYEFEKAKDILELSFVKKWLTSTEFKHFILFKYKDDGYLTLQAMSEKEADDEYGFTVAKIYYADNLDWSNIPEIKLVERS